MKWNKASDFSAVMAPLSDGMEEHRFKQILTRAMAVPLGFGLVSVIFFILIINYLIDLSRWVEKTDAVVHSADALLQLIVDQESSVRGFLISGREDFLDPYLAAQRRVRPTLEDLRQNINATPAQTERLELIGADYVSWREFAETSIAMRRRGESIEDLVASGHGKRIIDDIRALNRAFIEEAERVQLERSNRAQTQVMVLSVCYFLFSLLFSAITAYWGRRQLLGLATTYRQLLSSQGEQARHLQHQAWLHEGQTALAENIIGQLPLPILCQNILACLARQLDCVVGALYVSLDEQKFDRVATYGFSSEMATHSHSFEIGVGLAGQAAAERRLMYFNPLDAAYFNVNSALGAGKAASVAILPIVNDASLNAVLEIGFLREIAARDIEFLNRIGENIGAAINAANYRRRLHEALSDMQQLNDELQAQQEELRMANEELEEQSKILEESQVRLETQQAELEQSNLAIEEQHEVLRHKNEALEVTQTRLEEHAQELERASRYKSEFLANMSHELRTPLNSSLILSKMLAENAAGNLTAEQVKFADSIYAAGHDLLAMINDILDISKVEAGKLDVRLDKFVLSRMLLALTEQFRALAQQKEIDVELVIDPSAPVTLYTDRHRLEQILRNLLSNAVKFTERGSVTLRVWAADPDSVSFSVTDTGIGVEQEQLDRIFDPFYQVDSTDSRRYGGTGLGLSISRQLAGLLGGRLELTSQPGAGSTFTVEIPLFHTNLLPSPPPTPVGSPSISDSEAPSAARRPARAVFNDDRNQLSSEQKTILVIEDELTFAGILFDFAHQLNYQCLVAVSAEEGIELALEHVPHAVILDMKLPDQSGMNVLARLKDEISTRHIPVHIISVEDRAGAALSMGAIGYLMKPVSREQLHDLFAQFEKRTAQKMKRVLVAEPAAACEDTRALIADVDVEVTAVNTGAEVLAMLQAETFDCLIVDLELGDMRSEELLQRMSTTELCSFPPVIIHASREVTREEEERLLQFSRSIIIKGARSAERLLDEVTLFLHKVDADMSSERRGLLQRARSPERALASRKILIVDDDVRNVFALTSALENKGALVEIGRNGLQAIAKLDADPSIELVLMDIMMPEMDGYQAMEALRKDPRFRKLPIIAVTARAMPDDQERCLRAGASDYVAKPVDMDKLLSLIKVWLPKIQRTPA